MFASVFSIASRVCWCTRELRRNALVPTSCEMSQVSRTRVPPSTGSSS